MLKITIKRANGVVVPMLIQPTNIVTIDQDSRTEQERNGSNAIITMQDGKKLWAQETVEQIAAKLGA